jgi:hypothetical protein
VHMKWNVGPGVQNADYRSKLHSFFLYSKVPSQLAWCFLFVI